MTYRIHEEKVSHELIDGEVIVINFDNGNYFSLTGTAAALWQALVQPASAETLAAAFAPGHAGAREEIQGFLEELAKENLLAPCADAAQSVAAPAGVDYQAPVVNKYTDMQQLLLADPLHEVDEAGWPNLPKDA